MYLALSCFQSTFCALSCHYPYEQTCKVWPLFLISVSQLRGACLELPSAQHPCRGKLRSGSFLVCSGPLLTTRYQPIKASNMENISGSETWTNQRQPYTRRPRLPHSNPSLPLLLHSTNVRQTDGIGNNVSSFY